MKKALSLTLALIMLLMCVSALAEIDMSGDPYTVAIQVVTLPGTTLEQETDIEEKINAITVPAINCKVDIQNVWISEVNNKTSMGIAGNEKIDLIHVATVQPLSSIAGKEMLYDLNEDGLLAQHGPALTALFGDYLSAGSVNGMQLAVPAATWLSKGFGFYYNKDMADKLGVEIPEMSDMDGIEKALYAVKAADPEVMPYYTGAAENLLLQYFVSYEAFGSNCSYGVVLDPENDPTVVNMYETDLFRDYCLRMYKWKKDGIMPGDTTDSNTNQAYFTAEKLFIVPCEVTPAQKAQMGASCAPITLGWVSTAAPEITNATVTSYMWGLNINSERPDKAVDFLNFLYSNAEVANLLKFGIEGVNYDFAEGSDSVIVLNNTYRVNFLRCGDEHMMYISQPGDENYVAECAAYDASAKVSPLVGYMFNDEDFQTESSILSAAIKEYLPRLQSGSCESEEAVLKLIDEFNAKLRAGGIEDVIAANQEQINAYLGK